MVNVFISYKELFLNYNFLLGAVVAREYGLPCIVGVQDARKFFKTGDILLMDGGKGEIKTVTNLN